MYEAAVPTTVETHGTAVAATHDPLELEDELEVAPGEPTPSATDPDEPADPFRNLAGVLDGVARDAGATEAVATVLRGLLGLAAQLRRELRHRGVAAFGLVAEAA